MSWFSQQWNRFAGQQYDDPNEPIQRVEVIWGRERLNIPINEQSAGQAVLQDLKHAIEQHTHVPYDQIKLIMSGLVLKDDKAPLAAYNLRNGSRLTLVGTQGGVPLRGDMPGAKSSVMDGKASKGEEMARRKQEQEQDTSEAALLARIGETGVGVRRDLLPEVKEFERFINDRVRMQQSRGHASEVDNDSSGDKQSQSASTKAAYDALSKQQKKLSELLLRALLALDSINVQSEEVRKRRKEAVKEVQSYLDRVDQAWSQIKSSEGS